MATDMEAVGTRGVLTIKSAEEVDRVANWYAAAVALDTALGNVQSAAATDATNRANTAKAEAADYAEQQDEIVLSSAATDATNKANTAKAEAGDYSDSQDILTEASAANIAITDATTKYGTLPTRTTNLETDVEVVEGKVSAIGIVDIDSPEWPLPITDSSGAIIAGVDADGKFRILRGDIPIDVLNPDVGLLQTDSSEWPWAIADADGYVIAGVNADGEFVVNRGGTGGASSDRSSRTQIAFIGDSLVAGYSAGAAWDVSDSIATKLQAVMPAGVTVTRNGYTGATTGQINLFMGALEVYARIPGGTIPASGVFPITVDQAVGGLEPAASVVQVTGWLKASGVEVYGNIRREADGTWNFNRLTAGDVVPASTASFTAANRTYKTKTVIYQPGRNDVAKDAIGPDSSTVAHVLSSYADMVDSLTPHTKQIIVTGTITRTIDKAGDPLHQEVLDIRAGIKARYPNYFVDLQDYLVNKAMSDLGLTPTAEDIQAVADYTIPPSLMDDMTHYSRATANAIAVNLYAPFLKKKGWV